MRSKQDNWKHFSPVLIEYELWILRKQCVVVIVKHYNPTIYTIIHSFSARSKAYDVVPLYTRDSLQKRSPQTEILLLQSPKRKQNRSIPVNPCCPKKIQDRRGDPWRQGSSPPANFQDHLLHRWAWRPRLSQQQLRFGSEGCLRSLKPFPPEGGLESVDGILRPEPRGQEGREWAFTFSICSFSDTTILQMQFDRFHYNTQLGILSVEWDDAWKHLAGTDFQLAKSDSLSPL